MIKSTAYRSKGRQTPWEMGRKVLQSCVLLVLFYAAIADQESQKSYFKYVISIFYYCLIFLIFIWFFFRSFVSFYVWMCLFFLFALLRLRMGEKGRKLHIFLPSRCLVTLKFLLEILNCGYYQKNQIGIWHTRFKVNCCLLFFSIFVFLSSKIILTFFIFGINWYRKLTPYFERTNKNEFNCYRKSYYWLCDYFQCN